MKKNNFLTILATLSSEEIRKFDIHINAYHKNSNVLLLIYKYYHKFFLKKKSPPDLPIVYEKLFGPPPKIKRPLAKLQNGLSDLNLILKDFLIQLQVLETNFEKEFLWLKILEKKELSHERDLHLKKIIAAQKENKSTWSALNEMKLYHHDFFRNNLEKENPKITLIENSIQSLDEFYFGLQLKYSAELQNRKNLLSINSQKPRLLRPILNLIKKDSTSFSLPTTLYYNLYYFFQKRNYKNFSSLKNFLEEQKDQLHAEEKSTVLIYLINFLAQQLRNGKYEHQEETLELYKFGLQGEKVLIQNKIIDPITFQNVVNIACNLKDYNYVESFINENQVFLEPNIRVENTSIAKAMLQFEKGEFKKVIANISNIKFNNVHFIIRARIYLLACDYELAKTEDLDILCQTFVKYARRITNLGSPSKNAAIKFGLILNHLFLRTTDKIEIKKEIDDTEFLYFRAWLIKKLEKYTPHPT